ncbi:hypothetical protein EB796_006323 [Bugula neritina]|uniref:Uncharacterized protein n=1 Tax=Bugula neritina TaxID=10212 RepID=A0A7J7K9P3_BUGNE|nr:hypothetical protein EB796_006323 [Bugula neritina]
MKACLTGIIQIFEIEKQQRQQEAMKEQVKSVSTGPLSRRREQKGCVVTLPSRQQSLIHQLGQCACGMEALLWV